MGQNVPVPKCPMPRNARKKSKSGYLHLIIRGNNRQILFGARIGNLEQYQQIKEQYAGQTK